LQPHSDDALSRAEAARYSRFFAQLELCSTHTHTQLSLELNANVQELDL